MAIFTKKLGSWIGTLSVMTVLPLAVAKPAAAGTLVIGPDIVINGSFENTPKTINDGGWDVFSAIEGWNVSVGSSSSNGKIIGIEVQRGAAGNAFDGKNLVELDGNGNTGIFQDLNTIAGQTYQLSFAFSARPDTKRSAAARQAPANIDWLNIKWGNQSVDNLTASSAQLSNTAWKTLTYKLVATSAITRLSFDNFGSVSDTFGTYIDNVSVSSITSVPEPGSIMGLIAFGAFGATSLRKGKHQKVTTQA